MRLLNVIMFHPTSIHECSCANYHTLWEEGLSRQQPFILSKSFSNKQQRQTSGSNSKNHHHHNPNNQAGLVISTSAECGATPYFASTPALPPGVMSRGGGRLVSSSRHHLRPAGGLGSVALTC